VVRLSLQEGILRWRPQGLVRGYMSKLELSPQILLSAYSQGIFPMADDGGTLHWYDPDPRAIIPLESFNVPRSLRRVLQQGRFEIRYNTAFREVMEGCAEPAPGREQTWISPELIEAYCALHRYGFAHSVETWQDGQLVGGLYGVALYSLFAGESMFSRVSEASKVALVALIEQLQRGGFQLLDIQFITPHLRQFGAIQIRRREYRWRLARAMKVAAYFPAQT
jgi:leucyl/phenylalanyl-tRNA--protein transferase